ncbi:ChrR family anti-sigma-E factor [Terricaulis silvestris]|uniref:Transcriptional activator ChrR n=1 Tax=Terricaulis silvestris TaxID=2686094 RepID=A0A6I6MMZ4_9CAUL|nr:ChrR family anti-sigma-E factor [Terricaulis silvestris]QGZ96059.1 Transcriptional activator ChrR [Terricaulis silvestris]
MNPRHHPTADVLAAYSAGALEAGFGLVVGAHVETCSACRASVLTYEAASGAALKELPSADVAADALTRVMSRLDEAPAPVLARDTRPLLERLPLKPRKWIAPGVWVAAVDTPHAPNNRVYLLSVKPGMPTARHEHSGAEFCTVLQGAYRDELGLFSTGDFAATDTDVNHQPVVQGDEDCICLFATEGRLKPKGLLGRIAFAYADV